MNPRTSASLTTIRKRHRESHRRAAQREADLELQRYILGLALLAFTAAQKTHLRQGCQLLPNGDVKWKKFSANGDDASWTPGTLIGEFAKVAAERFGVVPPKDPTLEFNKNLLKESIEADALKKADKRADNAGDPIENLKNLVNELEPVRGDKFSVTKTAKLTKLQEAAAAIEADADADASLKRLAASLKPLLIADAGAKARKEQMLAPFPSASGTAASEQTDQTPTPATLEVGL